MKKTTSRIIEVDELADVLKETEKKVVRKRKGLFGHLSSIGFTNRLAVYLVGLLIAGLFLGYKLAVLSIQYAYTGQLLCYTVVFTPIGTACSIVLGAIVKKSKAENVSGDTGIKFATAMADEGVSLAEVLGTESSSGSSTEAETPSSEPQTTTTEVLDSPPI